MNFKGAFNSIYGTGKRYAKTIAGEIHKNSPTLLSALAIGSTFIAYYNLWKLKDKITDDVIEFKTKEKKIEEECSDDQNEIDVRMKQLRKDTCITMAKHALPFAVSSTTTIAAIIASVSIGNKRYAAASALYTVSQQVNSDILKKTKETIGPGKTEKIKAEAMEEGFKRETFESLPIYDTHCGGEIQELFYDRWTHCLIRSNMDYMNKCINKLNELLTEEKYEWVSIYDFYTKIIGIECGKLSEYSGWNVDYNPVTGDSNKPINLIPKFYTINGEEHNVVYMDYMPFFREQYNYS